MRSSKTLRAESAACVAQTDREEYLRQNAVAIIAEKDALIEKLREEVRRLLDAKRQLRAELARRGKP